MIGAALALMALFAAPQCMVAGCSGQLCIEAHSEPVATTCEWQKKYACYPKYGVCEVQPDGKCGWTPGDALLHCLTYPEREVIPFTPPQEEESKTDDRNPH